MAVILIQNLGARSISVHDPSRTLLQHFQDHYLDWMHACGGKGRCTTCKLLVIAGAPNLSQPTAAETAYQQQGALELDERLACQVRTSGDIVISVPEEGKLPHIHYSA
ncbi:MAG TPA: 2Fe-2S iron-sulfur cluster-binding protein [Ohtaekwangia sp.]|nr:2Fe-2S iron-sulfur cluster-binding protein [Ohtaekwangia sp.]